MVRGSHVFAAEQHLFRQLFAGADAGVFDVDVHALFESGEANEIAREIRDLEHLTHVEHEQLTARAEGAGLQHELHGLGDRHEVPAHLGVRHRDRTAVGDLLEERRDHRAARAEHVAKADGDEVAVLCDRGIGDDLLCDTLGDTHDRRRTDRLVGRDIDEVPGVGVERSVDDIARAEHVVGNGLDDVFFHQGHVLVRGRMENCMRPMPADDGVDAARVTDVRDDRDQRELGETLPQLSIDFEDLVLAVVHGNERARIERGDLPAQLATDRAAGACDQHGVARSKFAHGREVRNDWITPQQVLNFDAAQRAHVHAAGDEVVEAWDRARLNPRVAGGLYHAAHDTSAGLRHRNDDLIHAEAADQRRQVRERPEHWNSAEQLTLFVRVVIDEPDDVNLQALVAARFAEDQLAGGAGANNDCATIADRTAGTTAREANEEARPGEYRRCEQCIKNECVVWEANRGEVHAGQPNGAERDCRDSGYPAHVENALEL